VRRYKTPWEYAPRYSWYYKAQARRSLARRREILQGVADSIDEANEEKAVITFPRLEWALQYRRIDDQPFSLARFRPLEGVYRDDHRNICVKKPAQVGISEFAVNYAVHAMVEGYKEWSAQAGVPKAGLNVAYCFPTKEALSDFSKERFTGLKRESEYFSALFADSDFDDVKFKQIQDSYLYLRGAWSVEALLSFPADVLILDEFDRMDPAAVELARKRLRQSLIKRQLCISTPTLPGMGIDALYKQSDQRVWEVECGKCGTFTELDYFRDVRASGADYQEWKHWTLLRLSGAAWAVFCPHCKGEIDRFGPGRWRVTNPEATKWHGYQIPALAFPSVKLEELAELAVSHDPTIKTEFYRSDLGIAYAPADSRITAAMLQKLAVDYDERAFALMKWTRTTMGIDVGAKLHYRIDSTGEDGRRYIRAVGAVDRWAELSALMDRYKVRSCVVDAHPELHKAKEWAEKFKGRVRRAYYPEGVAALSGKLFALGSSEERKKQTAIERKRFRARADIKSAAADSDVVQVNRTMAMDAVYAAIEGEDVVCSPEIANDPEFVAMMCSPIRVITKDDHGQERASWEHTAPDHLYHASVYCHIALESMPRGSVGVLGQGSTGGWTPKGIK
jgi:hypothetical protein